MRVSIIGLGWLGLPLAKFLLQKGFDVKGTTTSSRKAEGLKREGISAYSFFLDPRPQGEGEKEIFDADLVIINIPPRSRSHSGDIHLQQITELRQIIEEKNVPLVIFISATSVYPDNNQEVHESDILTTVNTGSRILLEAENILREGKGYELTVLRLGGLLGDDRIPGVYVSNKEQVVGHAPVNYIYRYDAVRLVEWIISRGLWDETYNGVTPFHPLRKEVYEKNAKVLGFPPPVSYESPARSSWKIVSSLKIIKTGFSYLYHPLDFPYNFSGKL